MKQPKIYQRTQLRLVLILAAILIVGASIYYTTNITNQLKDLERESVELWGEAVNRTFSFMSATEAEVCDITFPSLVMESNQNVPMILVDEGMQVQDVRNYGMDYDPSEEDNRTYFAKELEKLKKNSEPILIEIDLNGKGNIVKQYVYYRQSTLITSLGWFPYIQMMILAVFFFLAYLVIVSSRRAEQERVWVGMAKETAHQLGTPLTSLVGWIENLKMLYEGDEDIEEMANEMATDVEMLNTVATRFSKIGARPELKPVDVYENLKYHLDYIKLRAPRKVTFDFPDIDSKKSLMVNINVTLFNWVIENLMKNALDSMGGKGELNAKVSQGKRYINIDIIDTGKGIPRSDFKNVFKPGFSTKKRGWGLGLSLCKRIVEKYHRGKIFVKDSTVGKGTTFRIQLPKTN